MKIILIGIGVLLMINGLYVIDTKKYGPEAGNRGNYIKGKGAIVIGAILMLVGVVLVFAVLFHR